MNDDSNPYRPPEAGDESWSWLSLLAGLIGTEKQGARRQFARGEMIIFEGIAFFVDPSDDSLLYAASPSAETSDVRMNLIVAEIVRLVPQFAASHEYLQAILLNRKVAVCMVNSYGDKHAEFVREVLLDLDLLS